MGCGFSKWSQPRAPKKDGTTLVEMNIGHIRDAHAIVGSNPGGFTPLVLVPERSVSRIGWVYIPEGFVAMVAKLGADVKGSGPGGSWEPGFHQLAPWAQVTRLISTQNVVFDTPVKDCKTKDNVTCNINVLIIFSIRKDMAVEFVYNLGPEKLDDLLRAQQEESVRQMATETAVEDIYDLHGKNTEQTLQEMDARLGKFGVKIHSFTITSVRIPDNIAATLQEKTLYAALAREKQKEQDLAMLQMNNNQNQNKERDTLENEKEQAQVSASTMQAQMAKQIAEVSAITSKKLSAMDAESRAAVAKIRADADLQVAQWDKERASMLKEFSLGAKAEAQKIRNEAEIFSREMRSQAAIESAKIESEGKQLVAAAQGKGKEAFQALRTHELELAKLQVIENLLNNPKLQVHSSSEQVMGLVPENNLLNQAVYQGVETLKLKMAEIAHTSASKVLGVEANKVDISRHLPPDVAGLGGVAGSKLALDSATLKKMETRLKK